MYVCMYAGEAVDFFNSLIGSIQLCLYMHVSLSFFTLFLPRAKHSLID
jgi:hypothetical protein